MHSNHGALRFLLMMSALIIIGITSSAFTKGMSSVIFFKVDRLGFSAIMLLLAAATIASAVWHPVTRIRLSELQIQRLSLTWIAVAAAATCVCGTILVHHGFPFSMDEFMTKLQGEIFLAGRVRGEVPEELRQFGRAMYHSFATYDRETGHVVSGYRPGMAALYAAFELLELGLFVSAAAVGGERLSGIRGRPANVAGR